jgi:hypothetical protein
MQPIMCVVAILLLIGIAPKRYNEKPAEKVTLTIGMQETEKETIKTEEDDYSGNDFSIYWSGIDISSM